MSTSASLITYLNEVIDWLSNVNNDVTQPLINPKEPHPNHFVTLDGLREDEMVENQLLISDDFLEFLFQTRAGTAGGKTESSQHSSMVSSNTDRTVESVDSSPKINIINNVILPPNDSNTRNVDSPRINIINNVLLPLKNNRSETSEVEMSQRYDTIQKDHPPSQVQSSNDYSQVASPRLETNWNGRSQMVHPPATQPTYFPSAALGSPARYIRKQMVRKRSADVELVKLSPEGYANEIYEAAARQTVPSIGYNRNQLRQQTMPLTQIKGDLFGPTVSPTSVQQVRLSPNDKQNQTYETVVMRQMVPPSKYNQNQTRQQTTPEADISQSYGTIQKDHPHSQVQSSLNDYDQLASPTLETSLNGRSQMVHPPATQPKYSPSAALVSPARYIRNQITRKQTEGVVQVKLSPKAYANQTYEAAAMRQTVPSVGYNPNPLRQQTMPLTQMNSGIFGPKVSPTTLQQVRLSPNDNTNETYETAVMRQMVPQSEYNQNQTRQQSDPKADMSQSYGTIQKDYPPNQVQTWLNDYGPEASPTLETNFNGRTQMVHPPATQPKYSPSAALVYPAQYIRNQLERKQSAGVEQVKLSPEGYANQTYEAAAIRQTVPSIGYNPNQLRQQTMPLTQMHGGILGPKVSPPTLQQVRLSPNGGNTNQTYGTEQKIIYSATERSMQATVGNTNRMMPYSVAIRRQAKLLAETEHPRRTSMPRNDTNYSHQISPPETSAETFESTPGLNQTTMNNVKQRRRVTKPELSNPNPMSSFPAGNQAMVSGHPEYNFAVPNRKHTTSVYQHRVGTNYPGMNRNHVVQYMDDPVNGSNYMDAQTGQRYYPANNYNQNGYYCMPNLGNPHRPATVRTPGHMSCMRSDQQAEIRPASTSYPTGYYL